MSLCVLTGRQALPWGYSLASFPAPAYKVRRNANRLVAAAVCARTGDIALTIAVTSAARCVWMCALASVLQTAAIPSAISALHLYRTVLVFSSKQTEA